jgi:hypothetical protein
MATSPPSKRATNWIDICDLVPEAQKLKAPYLHGNIDYSINTLVVERDDVKKAHAFYNGERDPEEYAFLTENFGVGNPSDITFVPLIRQHIKVLLGILATNPLDYRTTCSDDGTLKKIQQEYATTFAQEVSSLMLPAIQSRIRAISELGEQGQAAAKNIELSELEQLQEYFENDWISSFEEAAYYVAQHHIQDKDLRLRFVEIAEELLVSGGGFYRVVNHGPGFEPEFKVCAHENLFFKKSRQTRFIKDCQRIVYREKMTVQEIINRFGHELKIEHLRKLAGKDSGGNLFNAQIAHGSLIEHMRHRWGNGESDYNLDPNESYWVYHVEWVANNEITATGENTPNAIEGPHATNKNRYRLDRYEGVRIGEGGEDGIYLACGKSKYVSRSVAKPWHCTLSYNGMLYDDKTGKPYSLVLKTKSLQDRYDILHFHLDNAVSRAGGKGVRVNVQAIPVSFGVDIEERIMRYLAYLKEGVEIIDLSQEGAGQGQGKDNFAHYGTYDLSLEGSSIKGLIDAIAKTEQTATSVTGVNPPMLGQVGGRDGLGTTNIAMQQGALSTKPYFLLIGEIMRACLTDLVNESRISYSKGKKGALLLGNGQRQIFTVEPGTFCNADHNVFFSDTGDEQRQLEQVQQLAIKFADAQLVDAEIAVDMITMKSLGAGKRELKRAIRKAKTSGANSAAEQLQQAQQQLQEMEGQLKALQNRQLENESKELEIKSLAANAEAAYKRSLTSQGSQRLLQEDKHHETEMDLERDEIIFDMSGNNKEVSTSKKK